MADHPARIRPAAAVLAQRYIAMRTFYHMSAGSARDKPRHPPPVEKKHGLFSPLQPVLKKSGKAPAQNGTVARCKLAAQIRHRAHGQRLFLHPLRELQKAVHPVAGAVIALKRRRGGSQNNTGIFHRGALHRGLPRVIPGHASTLVGSFMLLVDYNKPQILKWCEQRGTRSDDNVYLPVFRPQKLIIALPGRHF